LFVFVGVDEGAWAVPSDGEAGEPLVESGVSLVGEADGFVRGFAVPLSVLVAVVAEAWEVPSEDVEFAVESVAPLFPFADG
jgi:hypothetical protein